MDKKNYLEKLISSNDILSINPHNILCFARIKKVGQLLSIAKGEEVEGITKNKISNSDTIILARYILEKTVEILGYDPIEIKEKPLLPITMKIGEKLIESNSIENFIIGTFIQKISYQVNTIHLRYERLNKHKQNVELRNDSSRDHLTGLLNRRSMELYLEDAISNKKRNGENYGVIIIDIDFFKIINDTYGHNTGDVVLEELALSFKEFFREEDKICRWGGEEFLILMKGGNKQSYIKKLNSLRVKIEETLVKLVNKKIKSYGCKCKDGSLYNSKTNDCCCEDEIDSGIKITLSIGISSLELNDNIKTVVNRADNGLYLAKNDGRNRVQYIENEII
ncbi:MAG: GGDEF domain-containing protein [Candidatus Gracilibacteria bacterium]|nr:GGDEF domain-containing protein [Candidatus Gracilibacteria bacterium]